jgi:hypothetical protein
MSNWQFNEDIQPPVLAYFLTHVWHCCVTGIP